jgi:hypothetical protein
MMNNEEPQFFTVGELKEHLLNLDDNCKIKFSTVSGVSPTFYQLKNWEYDKNDNVIEVLFEFSEP